LTWQALRQKELALESCVEQDTFVDLFGKPPLAPPKLFVEDDGGDAERDKAQKEADERAKSLAEDAAKPTSRWGKVRTHLKHVLVELAENHHILEVICSTKVDFPRRDRALCFLAYTLMMFVTSGLSYNVDFAGTSCCLDDEDYAPVAEALRAPYAWDARGAPTRFTTVENVTQSCAWWYNTTFEQNATTCKSNWYASAFTKEEHKDLLNACPATCGGCMQRSRLQLSCRIALTLINFLIALPPSVVLAMSFTNAFKTDRMNDKRWDNALPEIESIRERVKELRGYLRRYAQLGSWDKADLIVDVLLYVEEWSKVQAGVLFYFFMLLCMCVCVCVCVWPSPYPILKGIYIHHDTSERKNTTLSYRIVSYRILSNRIVSNRIVSYQIVSHRIVSNRLVSHHLVLNTHVGSRRQSHCCRR
jgi:hypothetical protein